MAEEKVTMIEKPVFPANFPEAKKELWHKTFDESLEQAKVDNPEGFHHQTARREANRHLRVSAPKSHAEAMKLEPWQFLKREVVSAEKIASDGYEPQGAGDHLKVVTIDGRKYIFAVPAKADKSAEK